MKEKICAVIVTYHPNKNLVSIVDILKIQVDKIIIVDNYSNYLGQSVIEECRSICNLEIIRNNINYGIATALNQGITYASNLGYEWVLTFDQDTIPFRDIVEIISTVYHEYPNKEVIGAIGVSYLDFGHINSGLQTNNLYIEKDFLITSGCLTSVSVFKKIGGFRDDFFMDHVDDEYSLRLKINGYISLLTTNPGMNHQIGFPRKITFLGVTLSSSNHSPQRKFYVARNQVILFKEYILSCPRFILKSTFFFIIDIFRMLLLDDNRLIKLKESIKGIYTGVFYIKPQKIE